MQFNELGELQLAVMQALWKLGPSSVHDVVAALPADRSPAYTTVLTVLRNLEKRGLVAHDSTAGSRMFLYKPLVALDDVRGELLQDFVQRLFDGSPTLLVRYILENNEIPPSDLAAIFDAMEEP